MLEDFWYDWGELITYVGMVAVTFAIVAGVIVFIAVPYFEQQTQERITLCMRAFEYTHDQCEFIVRTGVKVSK